MPLGTATHLSTKGLISARVTEETGVQQLQSLGIHPLHESPTLGLRETESFRGGRHHQTQSSRHQTTALPVRTSGKHLSISVNSTTSSSLSFFSHPPAAIQPPTLRPHQCPVRKLQSLFFLMPFRGSHCPHSENQIPPVDCKVSLTAIPDYSSFTSTASTA